MKKKKISCVYFVCIYIGINVLILSGLFFSCLGFFSAEAIFDHTSESKAPPTTNARAPEDDVKEPTKMYDRLVFLVIDALRADMVYGDEVLKKNNGTSLSQFMPYTRAKARSGEAQAYVAQASLPTVTLPRIKAMTTGRTPAFIDVLKNFNTAQLQEENIIERFHSAGYRLHFYGDDTWLKLFPKDFELSDGISGFFAKDTVQVDQNVTRHLHEDLDPRMRHEKSQLWDVLILHYLGLDHVGHLRGPRSELMNQKLIEMDSIVEQVDASILEQDQIRQKQDADAQSTLFVLVSDHGMTEMGNHGGASNEESSAVMLFVNLPEKHTSDSSRAFDRIMQVDLVPTLCALFGLEIPPTSTGQILPRVFAQAAGKTRTAQYLLALYQNIQQLWSLAQQKASMSFLNQQAALYQSIQRDMASSYLRQDSVSSSLERDMLQMLQQLQAELNAKDDSTYHSTFIFFGISLVFTALGLVGYVVHALNIPLAHGSSEARIFASMYLFYVLSFASSSSIENEHATVNFLCMTNLACLLYRALPHSTTKTRDHPSGKRWLLVVMALVRMGRSRNQVINFARMNGFESENEDDTFSIISDAPLFDLPLWCMYVLFWMLGSAKWVMSRTLNVVSLADGMIMLLFSVGTGVSYFHRMMDEERLGWRTGDYGVSVNALAQVVYLSIGCLMAMSVTIMRHPPYWQSPESYRVLWEIIFWIPSILLQRTSNLSMLWILLLQNVAFVQFIKTLKTSRGKLQPMIVSQLMWIGQCAFFALGNSHLVATIDISKAYSGVSDFSQVFVGFLTAFITFMGPILFTMTNLHLMIPGHQYGSLVPTWKVSASTGLTISAIQFFQCGVYLIIMYFMRYHLFIWTVFAPRFLYIIASTLMTISFTTLLIILPNLHQ